MWFLFSSLVSDLSITHDLIHVFLQIKFSSPEGALVPGPSAVGLAAAGKLAVCWESTAGVPAPAALPVVDPGVAGIPEEAERVPDGPALVPVAPDNATVG